jgi:hypothetical protein
VTTITARRPSLRLVFLAPEGDDAAPAAPTADVDDRFV